MRRSCVVAILISNSVSGCFDADTCPSLEKLERSDPISDAAAAIKQDDNSLLMLGGYVGTIPGAEGSSLPTKFVEGTTDYEIEACYRLRPAAEAYALKYNATIVAAQEPRGALRKND